MRIKVEMTSDEFEEFLAFQREKNIKHSEWTRKFDELTRETESMLNALLSVFPGPWCDKEGILQPLVIKDDGLLRYLLKESDSWLNANRELPF